MENKFIIKCILWIFGTIAIIVYTYSELPDSFKEKVERKVKGWIYKLQVWWATYEFFKTDMAPLIKQAQAEINKIEETKKKAYDDYDYLYELYTHCLSKHCDTMIFLEIGDQLYWQQIKTIYIYQAYGVVSNEEQDHNDMIEFVKGAFQCYVGHHDRSRFFDFINNSKFKIVKR